MEEQKVDPQRVRLPTKMDVASAKPSSGAANQPGEIILLNVGGKRYYYGHVIIFVQTLSWRTLNKLVDF